MTPTLLAILAAATPFTSGDWLVVCDHQAQCSALSQVPAGADAKAYPLVILRHTGDTTVLDLPIAATVSPGARIPLAIDGRVVAELVAPGGGGGLSLPFTGTLATAIRHGALLTIGNNPRRARVSLKGVAAAAEAIAAQRPTAPVPTIDVPAADRRAPRLPSRKMLETLATTPDKRCRPFVTHAERLDSQTSLVALDSACRPSQLYVLPDKGDARPAAFDTDAPVGGAWDAVQRRFAILLPPVDTRGCGTRRAYAWDGTRFRLAEGRFIAECRRATYEVVTYRATIIQR